MQLEEPIPITDEEYDILEEEGMEKILHADFGPKYKHCETCNREHFCIECSKCEEFYDQCEPIPDLETFDPAITYSTGDIVWVFDGTDYSRWKLTAGMTYNMHPMQCSGWTLLCTCECDNNEDEISYLCQHYTGE